MTGQVFNQGSINQGSSNKFRVAFSNLIGLKPQDVHLYYEATVKSVAIPSYDLDYLEVPFKNSVILNPISKANDELGEFTITFVLDDGFNNYFNLNQFIQKVRYGKEITTPYVHIFDIKTIDIIYMNNKGIDQKRLRFKDAVISNLGDLQLEFGNPEAPTFDCSFRYRQILIEDVE